MLVPIGLLALAACGASELLGPESPQGIQGVVLLGPMCPVVRADDPCPDQPYEAWIEIRNASGEVVTGVRSDAEGRFRFPIPNATLTFQVGEQIKGRVVRPVQVEYDGKSIEGVELPSR